MPAAWHVVGTGDFNGDGRDDILWRNDNGQISNWLGQANGGFVINDAVALHKVSTSWHVVGTGDYNGDGLDDILWRHADGTLSNWLGTANGDFVPNDVAAATTVANVWHVQSSDRGSGSCDIRIRTGHQTWIFIQGVLPSSPRHFLGRGQIVSKLAECQC